jgi:DNA-binding MarR family transcriptional regulator
MKSSKKLSTGLPKVGEGKRGTQGHISYLLRQAQAAVRGALDVALQDCDVTAPQFLILNLIHAYSDISGADLARISRLTPQTVNMIIRNLEDKALIVRTAHHTHGRILSLALTDQGSEKLTICKRVAEGVEGRILETLSPIESKIVRQWLVGIAEMFLKNGEVSSE